MRSRSLVNAAAAVVVLAAVTLQGQQKEQEGGSFKFKTGVELINVTASVSDASGRFVQGLDKGDFIVYEDGQRQEITHFSAERTPVSLGIVLDTSGSMAGEKFRAAQSALDRFLYDLLQAEDEVFILGFSDRTDMVSDWTTDRQQLANGLRRLRPRGGTALYDAVADALARLDTAEGRRVVVAMTDGRDENNPGTAPGSRRTLDEVLHEVRASGASVYSIGLGTKVDVRPLQQFAELSGGQMLLPQDASRLAEEFQRVIEDLGRRYVIGYTSTNPERDGQWRDVEIQVTGESQVSVRSSGGYTAPGR
jgi:Ca-activated chloride channel family protein